MVKVSVEDSTDSAVTSFSAHNARASWIAAASMIDVGSS